MTLLDPLNPPPVIETTPAERSVAFGSKLKAAEAALFWHKPLHSANHQYGGNVALLDLYYDAHTRSHPTISFRVPARREHVLNFMSLLPAPSGGIDWFAKGSNSHPNTSFVSVLVYGLSGCQNPLNRTKSSVNPRPHCCAVCDALSKAWPYGKIEYGHASASEIDGLVESIYQLSDDSEGESPETDFIAASHRFTTYGALPASKQSLLYRYWPNYSAVVASLKTQIDAASQTLAFDDTGILPPNLLSLIHQHNIAADLCTPPQRRYTLPTQGPSRATGETTRELRAQHRRDKALTETLKSGDAP